MITFTITQVQPYKPGTVVIEYSVHSGGALLGEYHTSITFSPALTLEAVLAQTRAQIIESYAQMHNMPYLRQNLEKYQFSLEEDPIPGKYKSFGDMPIVE